MKSFLAFVLFGSATAQNDASGNSTQSLRSLLSPRNGVTLSDAPKLSGTYCGWSQHDENIHCRMKFDGSKMTLEYKRKGTEKRPGCKDGKGPSHECCRCESSVNVDCKDLGYKVTPGGGLSSGLFSSGYDVHWSDSSCIQKNMGKDDKNPNKVPLRIKIHDEGHLDLLECMHQDDHTCDGNIRCDVVHNGPDGSGCDDWDGPHTPSCRRRAGCHSRRLPVPEDDLKICSASCSGTDSCAGCPPPDEDFGDDDIDDEPPSYAELDLDDIEVV